MGTCEIVLVLGNRLTATAPDLAGEPSERCLVVGAHSEAFVIDPRDTCVLGVHFRPGGAHPFFGLPTDEVRNRRLPLEALWGRAEVAELEEAIFEDPTPRRCFQLLEAALERRLEPASGKSQEALVAQSLALFEGDPQRSIRQTAADLGVGERRFLSLFRRQVGLSPKAFRRVRRFQQALRGLAAGRGGAGLADLALDCGYYDQPHLNHDFRAFTGVSPGRYLRLKAGLRNLNHLPLED